MIERTDEGKVVFYVCPDCNRLLGITEVCPQCGKFGELLKT